MTKFRITLACFILLALAQVGCSAQASANKLKIVAAENFYGDIAQQIGGDLVDVSSILSNPEQDPHLFEASPSVARNIAEAKIVVLNGLDYDPWVDQLLVASDVPGRSVINAGIIAGKLPGDNPHIWYDLDTMRKLASTIAKKLMEIDPMNAETYAKNAENFDRSLLPLSQKIAAVSLKHKGLVVAATEPVFGYMFQSFGFEIKELPFQMAVMNGTEPSISEMAQFENDLNNRVIKVLVYNGQATSPVADHMMALAKKQQIAIVPVSETEPVGKSYQHWMEDHINAIAAAIGG